MEGDEADPIALFEAEFRNVADLFARFERTGCDGRREFFAREACAALRVLIPIVREILPPGVSGDVECDRAERLIERIESSGPDEAYYDANMAALATISAQLAEAAVRGWTAAHSAGERKPEIDLSVLRARAAAPPAHALEPAA